MAKIMMLFDIECGKETCDECKKIRRNYNTENRPVTETFYCDVFGFKLEKGSDGKYCRLTACKAAEVQEEKDPNLKRYGEAEDEVAWEKIREAEGRLKPCPFCGGKAFINYVPPHTHGGPAGFMPDCKGEHFIECTGCTCAIAGGPDLDETIADWNKRTEVQNA
jgi:catechol 2,3-dioxygenase-like lactoylglutathione lyase family enzyme